MVRKMKKTLEQLYGEHRGKLSDKWSLYLTELDRLFASYRNRPIRLLEIGVQNGGSLEIWDKYFPHAAKIIGCDIDPKCAELRYRSARIAIVIGNANSEECEGKILQHAPSFDIIIDDGSHRSSDIMRSFARYFPHLKDDGTYVVEDLHCSYWDNFEGGLYNPFSAMSFFKRLTDIINHEHWRNGRSRKELFTRFGDEFGIDFENLDLFKIHSTEFMNSLCAIRKSPPEKNTLGNRVIVGTEEYVTSGTKQYNGTLIQDMPMEVKDDGNLDVFEVLARNDSLAQSVKNLSRQLAEMEQAVQRLTAQLDEKEQELAEIRRSKA